MNRREMLTALTGAIAASSIKADCKVLETSPAPLLGVIHCNGPLSPEGIANIREHWEMLWKGAPPCPLLVIPEGLTFDLITDPRLGKVEAAPC